MLMRRMTDLEDALRKARADADEDGEDENPGTADA